MERIEKKKRKLLRKTNTKGFQEKKKKTLINKLDIVFSKVIRARDKRCLYCGKGPEQSQLQCSHVYSRKNLSVRWDEGNAKTLCSYHHRRFWHEQPKEALEWLTDLWGDEHMKDLKLRANAIKQWTVPELEALYAELKEKLSRL